MVHLGRLLTSETNKPLQATHSVARIILTRDRLLSNSPIALRCVFLHPAR
jgi:hypothetical protein